jgi:hypothetical protein
MKFTVRRKIDVTDGNISIKEKRQALLRILKNTTQGTGYALLLGTFAISAGLVLPPELALLPQGILLEGFGNLIDSVVRGNEPKEEEIQKEIRNSNIVDVISSAEQTQVIIGRLFRRFDKLNTSLQSYQDGLNELSADIREFSELAVAISDGLKAILDERDQENDQLQKILNILIVPQNEEREAFYSYLDALDLYASNFPYITIYSSLSGKAKTLNEIFIDPVLCEYEDKSKGEVLFGGSLREATERIYSKHLFIRSQPGSGKSTMLRHITKHTWSNPTIVGLSHAFIPLTVRLQHLAVSEGISTEDRLRNALNKAGDLVAERSLPNGFLKHWPETFNCSWIIMFDGLDEIPSDRYARLCT